MIDRSAIHMHLILKRVTRIATETKSQRPSPLSPTQLPSKSATSDTELQSCV